MDYPLNPLYASRRSPVMAKNIAATSHPLATAAALQIMQQGGNALDGALASAITLTVVEPTGNGLGSDAFCILWDGKQLHGLNASGRSPGAWTPERFADHSTMPYHGWESVTVPGAVSAWVELSDKFGKLPFAELFKPAINYARNGFLVTPVIAEQWQQAVEEFQDQPGFRQAFMPNGEAPRARQIFQSEEFACSLEKIAQTKGEAFYRGELATAIVDFAEKNGAALSMKDMADHTNEWCGTISQSIGGAELHEIPPNGQGIAALMALGILRNTEIADLHPDSLEALHLQIEAMKLAFMDVETFVSDPDSMVDVRTTHLLEDDYLAARAKLIDQNRATLFPVGAPKDGGTVCLATGDDQGMMVSYIQSNYSGFGSGVVVPGTAISLQNRGAGFTLKEGHPNQVGPNKRPFHTIIPGMIMQDGEPRIAFGLMGGPIQAQGHLQMMLRTQIWGQDPQTAADAPRWRVVDGLDVAIEKGIDPAIVDGLKRLGHNAFFKTADNSFGFGGAQLVKRVDGCYLPGFYPRIDGHAGVFSRPHNVKLALAHSATSSFIAKANLAPEDSLQGVHP